MESERGQSAAVSAVVAMARITGQIIDRREVGEAGLSMTDKPQPIIFAMGTEGYLNLVAKLMGGDAPPAAADAPMVARMAKLGIVPEKPFEMSKLDPAIQAALKDIPQTALKKIEANKEALGTIVNGW